MIGSVGVARWVALVVAVSAAARAEEPSALTDETSDAGDSDAEAADEPEAPSTGRLRLAEPREVDFGLEAFSGLALEWVGSGERPHAVVGGRARLSYRYFETGASLEVSDAGNATSLLEPTIEHWHAIGGFLGAHLPYRHWVDVDFSLGLESRHYENPDAIYGPNGFDVGLTALTFRGGISDRSSEKTFGARVGAALVGSIDLSHAAPTWTRTYLAADLTTGKITGTTPVGGVSIALVVSVGLEAGTRGGE
jgi:hypothetical protein